MSRSQWAAIAVLSVMIAFVLGGLIGYLLMTLSGSFPAQLSSPMRPAAGSTGPSTDESLAPSPPTTPFARQTATAELTEPTGAAARVATEYALPAGPTLIPPVSVTPDSWEPDDSPADARLIGADETQGHNLHVKGDHDWLHFAAQEGETYVIETFNLGEDIDTVICLYDEEGKELLSDDDGGDESWASHLRWTATEDGKLYIAIHDFGDNQAGPGTSYNVSLALGEPFERDQYEPDNSRAGASEIAVGQSQSHNLHVAGDRDWVRFDAAAGTTYVIETFRLGSDVDTVIHLHDQEGGEIASDDDTGDDLLASRLEWTAEEDGTVYLLIEDLWGTSAGPGSEYQVSVSVP